MYIHSEDGSDKREKEENPMIIIYEYGLPYLLEAERLYQPWKSEEEIGP